MRRSVLSRSVAVGLLAAAVVLVAPVAAYAAPDCGALTPSASAATNTQAINGCLGGAGHTAVLRPGTFPVNSTLTVPSGASLVGDTTYPTIRLVPGTGTTALVRFVGSSARVGFLRLDAGNALAETCCSAVVLFEGTGTVNNLLDDTYVTGAPQVAGVYLLCVACAGNQMLRVDIYGNFYGVLFGPFNDAAHPNYLVSSSVHENRCDGVTFMNTDASLGRPGGYGVIDASYLWRNGRDCENGIPGAAVYSADNTAGGRITNTWMYDNCGNNLDIVESASFLIQGNVIVNPGFPVPGAAYYCTGTASVALVNVRDFTIVGNNVQNANSRTMARNHHDPNRFFNGNGWPLYSDLAGGANGIVGFLLASWRTGTPSQRNTIDGNTFIANCPAPCLGTGYFATRRTGYDAAGNWGASTTNYYTNNNPFGSNVGSTRGGGNWYAANNVCGNGSGAPCNVDDYQHSTAVNWARNDGFYFY